MTTWRLNQSLLQSLSFTSAGPVCILQRKKITTRGKMFAVGFQCGFAGAGADGRSGKVEWIRWEDRRAWGGSVPLLGSFWLTIRVYYDMKR